MTTSRNLDIFHWIKSSAGIAILMTLVFAIAVGMHKGPYTISNTIVTGGMLAMVSMGLALVFGVMNIGNFAHGEFFMIGTLVGYFVFTPLNNYQAMHPNATLAAIAPLIGILAAAIAGILVGALVEVLIFAELRKRSRSNWVMNTFLITLGLSVILANGAQLLFGVSPKGIIRYWSGKPFDIMGVFISRDRAISLLISAIVVMGFWAFMKYSKTGQSIRAVSQDEAGALSVGIELNVIQIITMSLSCGLAAVAGATLLFIYPSYPTVGLEPLYMAWFVVILAGLGNIMGAGICSFIVALLKVATVEYIGMGWDFVLPTAIITFILIIKPSGIFGSAVRGVLDE
ncbi:MAG: branched-chain amino acid ABC transporter permease [Deltaproteobacteria bacterium]|nr:branched-chain amino acid ABC transporter permease [Deltaproteobacteria bacterium]